MGSKIIPVPAMKRGSVGSEIIPVPDMERAGGGGKREGNVCPPSLSTLPPSFPSFHPPSRATGMTSGSNPPRLGKGEGER